MPKEINPRNIKAWRDAGARLGLAAFLTVLHGLEISPGAMGPQYTVLVMKKDFIELRRAVKAHLKALKSSFPKKK